MRIFFMVGSDGEDGLDDESATGSGEHLFVETPRFLIGGEELTFGSIPSVPALDGSLELGGGFHGSPLFFLNQL